MFAIQTELWLYSRRVYAVSMEAAPYLSCKCHVASRPLAFEIKFNLHVQRRNHFDITQLPNMQMVAAQYARKFLDVSFDVVNVDIYWRGLEQYA